MMWIASKIFSKQKFQCTLSSSTSSFPCPSVVVGSLCSWKNYQLPPYVSVACQWCSFCEWYSSPPSDVASIIFFLVTILLLRKVIPCRMIVERLLVLVACSYHFSVLGLTVDLRSSDWAVFDAFSHCVISYAIDVGEAQHSSVESNF